MERNCDLHAALQVIEEEIGRTGCRLSAPQTDAHSFAWTPPAGIEEESYTEHQATAEALCTALGVDAATGLRSRDADARRACVGRNEPLSAMPPSRCFAFWGTSDFPPPSAEWWQLAQRCLSPKALVRRDSGWAAIPADQLVPGDIVLLLAGWRAHCDVRVLAATPGARVDLSPLTGEPWPVDAPPGGRPVDAAPSTQRRMLSSHNMVPAAACVIRGVVCGAVVRPAQFSVAVTLVPPPPSISSGARTLGKGWSVGALKRGFEAAVRHGLVPRTLRAMLDLLRASVSVVLLPRGTQAATVAHDLQQFERAELPVLLAADAATAQQLAAALALPLLTDTSAPDTADASLSSWVKRQLSSGAGARGTARKAQAAVTESCGPTHAARIVDRVQCCVSALAQHGRERGKRDAVARTVMVVGGSCGAEWPPSVRVCEEAQPLCMAGPGWDVETCDVLPLRSAGISVARGNSADVEKASADVLLLHDCAGDAALGLAAARAAAARPRESACVPS